MTTSQDNLLGETFTNNTARTIEDHERYMQIGLRAAVCLFAKAQWKLQLCRWFVALNWFHPSSLTHPSQIFSSGLTISRVGPVE